MLEKKLKNIINDNFEKLFFIEKKDNDFDEYIFYTPLFLNDGNFVYFYICEKEDKIIFSNDMYKYVEDSIKLLQKNKNIIKDYFLNKKGFEKIIKDIESQGIKHSLLMEKTIKKVDITAEEIGKYLITIIKYYNYFYDYSMIYSRDKEAKEKEFKISIDNFIEKFNSLNEKKIVKLKDTLHNKIDYFEYNDLAIFTGIYTELDLYQAFGELEKKVENENKKALILVDKKQSNLVKYIKDTFLKIYSQDKVKILYSNDYSEVSKNISEFIGAEKNAIQ